MINQFGELVYERQANERFVRVRRERHEFIKSRLRLLDTSLAAEGRKLGVSRVTMTSVSNGTHSSERIQKHLAETLGLPAEDLWPEIFQCHVEETTHMEP